MRFNHFNCFQSFSIIFNHFNHFQLFSIIFNHFQLFSIIFNHFQSFSIVSIIFNNFQLFSIIFNHCYCSSATDGSAALSNAVVRSPGSSDPPSSSLSQLTSGAGCTPVAAISPRVTATLVHCIRLQRTNSLFSSLV